MTTVSEPAAITAISVFPNTLTAQIKKRLSGAGREFTLDVDFALSPGVAILFGASGAGKTTLLDCLAGVTRPDSGRISGANESCFDEPIQIYISVRFGTVGYVFHDIALFLF